jgi:NAD(P)-dependent dehydrogenase (short-subunit alcohol dehydrogenase family)
MAEKWTTADLPRQDGKVVIVTGANSGLGFHAALELGRVGAEVILACRDSRRGQAALDRMLGEVPDGRFELRSLDLSDLGSVREFAADAPDRIDVLCNNAGVMATPYRTTTDGFELQFGTNYLGHFALTGLVLDRLLAAGAPRVVTAGSNMHKMGKIPWDDLNSEQKYRKWSAYSNSKLANLMFAYELQRRSDAARAGLISAAAHPGWAATDLYHKGARVGNATLQEKVMTIPTRYFAQSSLDGALPTLYAATMPDVRPGAYLGPSKRFETVGPPTFVKGSGAAGDEASARRLWDVSEQLTGVSYDWEQSRRTLA